MLVSQAPGAQVEPFYLAIYNKGNCMNIRNPAAVGVAFGVAHVMAELGGLSA